MGGARVSLVFVRVPGLRMKSSLFEKSEEVPTSLRTADRGSALSIRLGSAGANSVFRDERYHTWGASPIRDDSGKYHIFYSRWKKELGFQAWVTHSEIAHAVSETPDGPYTYADTALPARGPRFWDGCVTHNPSIHRFNSRYFLYYTGNTGDRRVENNVLNPLHRNNQRIGAAVSDSPYGPWTRYDAPLIDTATDPAAPDALMVSNPAVLQMPNGRFLLVYKAAGKKNPGILGGPVVHMCALSDSPCGPFVKQNAILFSCKGSYFPAEDPYIWHMNGAFYAVVKDMHGTFTHRGRSLALFFSHDGIDWNLADDPFVAVPEIHWENGRTTQLEFLERPQMLKDENGVPFMIFLAAMNKTNKDTFNVHIPLEIKY